MLDGPPVMEVGSPSRRSESLLGAWLHGCMAWLWALALAGHANAINPTVLPLYLLVNTATIIIQYYQTIHCFSL
jgi:hypothetical protein